MSKSWVGDVELGTALQSLAGQSPPSATLIKKVSQTALKFTNEYKMVVFEIEKYIKRVSAGDRLAVIFVVDAMCRSSQAKDKDVFTPRFGTRIKQICSCLQDISPSDKASFARILEDWRKRNLFSADALPSESEYPRLSGDSAEPGYLQQLGLDTVDAPRSLPAMSSLSGPSGSASSAPASTVVVAASAAPDEAPAKATRKPGHDKRKAVKLCPFREGNCPYAEKCRYSHDQSVSWQESVGPKLDKKRPFANVSVAAGTKTLVYGQDDAFQKPKGRELANPSMAISAYPVTHADGQPRDVQKEKFARTKLDCAAAIGSATFSRVPAHLFGKLVA